MVHSDEFTIDKIFGSYKDDYIKAATEQAFREYTGSAYEMMNRVARYGKITTLLAPLSEKEKEASVTLTEKRKDISANATRVDSINEYFKFNKPFIPQSRMILYRKIKENNISDLLEKGTLIDKSFTSTTMSAYMAININTLDRGNSTTVRLHLLPFIPYKLYPIKYLSGVQSEEEVLFDSNMKYYLCNTKHFMKVGDSIQSCMNVLDCIFIPQKFGYLLEGEWFDRWNRIINAENKYIFTDIIPINCYHRYDRAIFHFINEIEYFIQKNIWENMIDYDTTPLINNPYLTIRPFAETLISDYEGRFSTTKYEYINLYKTLIRNKIIMRCIEFAENIPKKNHFRYRYDWLKFVSEKNVHLKKGGAVAQPALQILADLNTLLKAVDGAQCANTAGLKKEIKQSIRNVKALVGKPLSRSA